MSKRLGTTATILLLSVFFSACATQRVRFTGEYNANVPNYEVSQPFFIAGIGQEREVDLNHICKNRAVDKVETKQTFVDGLLGFITFGIYTPRTLAIYCK